jgi:hypothetical protein
MAAVSAADKLAAGLPQHHRKKTATEVGRFFFAYS